MQDLDLVVQSLINESPLPMVKNSNRGVGEKDVALPDTGERRDPQHRIEKVFDDAIRDGLAVIRRNGSQDIPKISPSFVR